MPAGEKTHGPFAIDVAYGGARGGLLSYRARLKAKKQVSWQQRDGLIIIKIDYGIDNGGEEHIFKASEVIRIGIKPTGKGAKNVRGKRPATSS